MGVFDRPIRVLCCREYQNSIKDSVHKLLYDQIHELGLSEYYQVQRDKIIGPNGTEFGFEGLHHNVNSIKSYEGVDIAWVEEAQVVSNASWDTLIPTIRRERSEIWMTLNPQMKEDATYKRFVQQPPKDAWLCNINWRDNPWFPEVLRKEKDALEERDPQRFLNIWEGHCVEILDGAIYAQELMRATKEGRITRVPYVAGQPVHTIWDLGWADQTSIWFAQAIGFEYRFIDYVSDTRKSIADWLKILQSKPYVYGTDYMPHDADTHSIQTGLSVTTIMRNAGRKTRTVQRAAIAEGINAARMIFDRCYFDEVKCADGLQALRHYRYEFDEDLKTYKKTPLHDWASHGADAFRMAAMSLREPDRKKPEGEYRHPTYVGQQGAWMA
jgi:phage terminase large subunit